MVILGSLELLQRRLPKDHIKITQLLDNAIQGTHRGTALTQRMLAFARRQELKPNAVDAPTLVLGMTELLQSSLGPSIQVETRFPLDLPKIYADPNQLELAVLNLAVNARDAMPKGGSIIIAAKEQEPARRAGLKPGHYVCLSVTDHGCGMDEKTLAHAMEPFFTTKGIGKGTGLGLPMVHGMAQQSGGKLTLISRLGEGTAAELWLPVASAEAGSVRENEKIRPPRKIRPLTVLTVDDDSPQYGGHARRAGTQGFGGWLRQAGARNLPA
jgi:signal transduction histidine kinase